MRSINDEFGYSEFDSSKFDSSEFDNDKFSSSEFDSSKFGSCEFCSSKFGSSEFDSDDFSKKLNKTVMKNQNVSGNINFAFFNFFALLFEISTATAFASDIGWI